MSTQYERPDSDATFWGDIGFISSPGGAGALGSGALADESDASRIRTTSSGGYIAHYNTPVAFPTGSAFKGVRLDLRAIGIGGVGSILVMGGSFGSFGLSTLVATSFSPVNFAWPWGIYVAPVAFDVRTDLYTTYTGNFDLLREAVALIYVLPPIPSVQQPPNLGPNLTTNNKPTITWDFEHPGAQLDTDGGNQTNFEVNVYQGVSGVYTGAPNGGSPAAASGIQKGASRSWQVPVGLAGTAASPTTYRAFVRTAQTVNNTLHWSTWTSTGPRTEFTVATNTPGVPTLTVTPSNTNGWITWDATTTAGVAGTSTDWVQVQHSFDGGTTWEDVRTFLGGGLLVAASPDGTDYEAPNGTATQYRARSIHDYGAGFLAYSAWSSTATATWTSTDQWLKHPFSPIYNRKIDVVSPSGGQFTAAARMDVYQPLGATEAVAVSDERGAETGTLSIKCDTIAAKNDIKALMDAEAPLLLQFPTSYGEPDRWLAPGDRSWGRYIDGQAFPYTKVELQWTEVDRPLGVLA